MRLTNILQNFNLKNNFENNHGTDYSPYRVPVRTSQPPCDYFVKNNDSVSFQGRMPKVPSLVKPTIEDIINKATAPQIYRNNILRLAKYHIPCPCCGRIMMDLDSFNDFKTSVCRLYNPHDILIQIDKYKRYLHPVEKNIFKMFVSKNKHKNPTSLLDILKDNRDNAEKNLLIEQSKIFVNIGLLSRELPPENCEKVNKLLKKTYGQLFDKEPTSPFSRKIFISELDNILANAKKRLRQNIIDTAITLPTAYNSVDAFIVKYAQKNYKNQNPDQAIAIRLLSNSIATIEHINPQKLKGTNAPNNLALECACDNNKRNHDSLFEQIKYNPQMPQNYQLYIKRLAQLVEEYKLDKSYVIQTNNTFGYLSDHILYRDLHDLRYKKTAKKTKAKAETQTTQKPKAKKQKRFKNNKQSTNSIKNKYYGKRY